MQNTDTAGLDFGLISTSMYRNWAFSRGGGGEKRQFLCSTRSKLDNLTSGLSAAIQSVELSAQDAASRQSEAGDGQWLVMAM
jgi:hypothetical protein